MRAVFGARKVYHAIDARESGTPTAVSMRVELLLGQNVAAALWNREKTLVRWYKMNNTIGRLGEKAR